MKQTNEIQRTNNYYMFKRLEGNRFVDPKKVNKLKKSIEAVGYIETDNLISLIDDLFKKYMQLEDKFIEYDTKVNESYHEHFINEQIDRGMHPHEYE